jgi:cellulose synthase/poly-beta-1,6-N-acetylglucosamine synthase-like glycosyltransferase
MQAASILVQCLFWFAATTIVYTYAGYPLFLFLRARFRPLSTRQTPLQPFVSVVIAAHNEATNIERKLKNLFSLNLISNKFEVIVVSDGSTDSTNEILQSQTRSQLRVLFQSKRAGKAVALNRAVQEAKGEIIIFNDTRQIVEPGAIEKMLSNFADPSVGCVSGALIIGDPDRAVAKTGESVKMAMENRIRSWEGKSGSMIGALGAFYAARKELIVEIPEGTLLDDVYVPLHIIRQGYRVILEDQARAWDDINPSVQQEFSRKVRTLTGNYQLLKLAPWLMGSSNPVWMEFFSHKILRLASPFMLLILLLTSFSASGEFYKIAGAVQVLAYLSALFAIGFPALSNRLRFPNFALTFTTLNAAAFVAFLNSMRGKSDVWIK